MTRLKTKQEILREYEQEREKKYKRKRAGIVTLVTIGVVAIVALGFGSEYLRAYVISKGWNKGQEDRNSSITMEQAYEQASNGMLKIDENNEYDFEVDQDLEMQ